MKKFAVLLLGVASTLLTACSGTSNQSMTNHASEIVPYPVAQSGYTRSVIYLPALKNEQNAKVELMIGKDMMVDCNLHRLSGSIKQEDLKGWAYPYYVIDKVDNGISTLMACSPDDKERIEFVTINHNLGLIDYNSHLPIVVYTPIDIQVKYRIWSTQEPAQLAVIK